MQDLQRMEMKIDQIVQEKISERTPGFSLMITRGEQILLRKGYGMADLERGIPIDPEDHFIIASNTKQFTCIALLMLQQRVLLHIDQPASDFFPDFPKYIKHITVRQMMCHTSGIKEYFHEEFRPAAEKIARADTAAMLEVIRDFGEDLNFEPDTAFSYCNSAYVMLGDIIRQLSGKPFGQFLETEIFAPLGMDRTIAPDYMDRKDPRQVKGYVCQEDGSFSVPPYDMIQVGYADGNISSDTRDLFTWHKYLYMSPSELLLKRDLLDQAFRPHRLKDGREINYGMGFFLGNVEDHSPPYGRPDEIWHTGGTEGFVSRCSRFRDAGISVFMLANYGGLEKELLFFPIVDAVFQEDEI